MLSVPRLYRNDFVRALSLAYAAGRDASARNGLVLEAAPHFRDVVRDRHGLLVWHRSARPRLPPSTEIARTGAANNMKTERASGEHVRSRVRATLSTHWQDLLAQARPIHWLKNLIVFVPLLTSQQFFHWAMW